MGCPNCRSTHTADNLTFWAMMQVPAGTPAKSVKLTVCTLCGTCYQPKTADKEASVITLEGHREGETIFQVELPADPDLCYQTRHTLKQDLQTIRSYLSDIIDGIESVEHNSQFDEDYKIKEWFQFSLLQVRTIMIAAWALNRQWKKMWSVIDRPPCPLDKSCYLRQGHGGECKQKTWSA